MEKKHADTAEILPEKTNHETTSLSEKNVSPIISKSPDLHVVILGSAERDILFNTFSRNICERWAIRYPQIELIILELPTDDQRYRFKVRVKMTSAAIALNPIDITVSVFPEGAPDDQAFDHFSIAAVLEGARKTLLLWLVPDDDLIENNHNFFIERLFYQRMVTLRQLVESLNQSNEQVEAGIYLFHVFEKNHRSGFKPWLGYKETLNKLVAEKLKRKSPSFYNLLIDAFPHIKFFSLPRNKTGSHLDYAPRWIDKLIFNEVDILKDTRI